MRLRAQVVRPWPCRTRQGVLGRYCRPMPHMGPREWQGRGLLSPGVDETWTANGVHRGSADNEPGQTVEERLALRGL